MENELVHKIILDLDYIIFVTKKSQYKLGYECISEIKFEKNQFNDEVVIGIYSDHANISLYKRVLKYLANVGYHIKKTEPTDDHYRQEDPLRGNIVMVKEATATDSHP
jgi:hypothetical protein